MKTFVQPGNTVSLPSPAGGVLSGQPMLCGSIFGVAAWDQPFDATLVEVGCEGVYDLPKTSGQAFTVGAPVYFNPSAKQVTGVAAANYLIGAATEAAASGAATARVRLNGTAAVVTA